MDQTLLVSLLAGLFIAVDLEFIVDKYWLSVKRAHVSYLMDHKLRVFDEEVIETLREVECCDLETEVIQHVLPLLAQLLSSPAFLDCLLQELNDVFRDNGLK